MYSQSVTRGSRALFVIAIDQSCSMAGNITINGVCKSKATMVADVVNDLIAELIERSHRSVDLADYYDIALIGYSGTEVKPLLGSSKIMSVQELNQNCVDVRQVEYMHKFPDGINKIISYNQKRWVLPTASGATPMYEALVTVRELVDEWCSQPLNKDSFPPMIFNITDGEPTDCNYSDLVDMCSRIKELGTNDGDALVFNIHIASEACAKGVMFPTLAELSSWNSCSKAALSLYEAASELPDVFDSMVAEFKGDVAVSECKAMCYNCAISQLVSVLNIGSRSVKLR